MINSFDTSNRGYQLRTCLVTNFSGNFENTFEDASTWTSFYNICEQSRINITITCQIGLVEKRNPDGSITFHLKVNKVKYGTIPYDASTANLRSS